MHRIISPFADVRGAPMADGLRGKYETQLVYGEEFIVESTEGDWAKGACRHDGYKGYVLAKHLGPTVTPTHFVTGARAVVYHEATIKSAPLMTLSLGSRLNIAKEGEKFFELADGGWISRVQVAPVADKQTDYIKTALNFLETPYYWGGRSGFGIDCSGLVQVALTRAGMTVPRDTEEQEQMPGETVDTARTGDIVFFKGHVGIMADADNLLHATAFHMKTILEPLWAVEARDAVTTIKRI